MTVLLVADHDGRHLKDTTARALTAALAMDSTVDILVAGNDCEGVAKEATELQGVRRVRLAQSPALAQELAETLSLTVADLASDYSHILFVSNALGKATMPRVAAILDVSPVSDIQAVVNAKTFVRGIYAGTLLATVEVTDPTVVATVRTTSFVAHEKGAQAPVETAPAANAFEGTSFVAFNEAQTDRPELVSARIVVAGGRGLHDEAGFKALEGLADQLGAAIGATRTAVDMGLCPNDWQVGQTGKMIAPELYLGFGISGAIQHTAGIKDAKIVVAVNNDPEEPIFEVADFGLVADGVETIEALKAKLR